MARENGGAHFLDKGEDIRGTGTAFVDDEIGVAVGYAGRTDVVIFQAGAVDQLAGLAALGVYVISLLFAGAAGFTIVVGDLASRFVELYFGVEFPW